MGVAPGSSTETKTRFPWRVLLALLLALAAQLSLELTIKNNLWQPLPGIILYAASALLTVWAWLKGELGLSPLQETILHVDLMVVNWGPALIALGLLLTSFFFFTDNLFTPLNVSLWLAGLALLVWAFWERGAESAWNWGKVKSSLRNIKFTRWTVVLLLAVGLVLFYRTYRLADVPHEPIADHAEKLLDVYDVLHGQTHIFFTRNTGREFFQFYLTAIVAIVFKTGVSFMSLKIGTTLAGLVTVFYIYKLAVEIGGRRVGLLALAFSGIAYWGNVISRYGLRYALYALFASITLYYLVRGLRRSCRNDIIIAGLMLGLGLQGYTAFRIMPFVVVVAFVLYWLHSQSRGMRTQSAFWFGLVVLMALMVFLPLLRYMMDNADLVVYRSITRLTSAEVPIIQPVWKIFLVNTGRALAMPFWRDGNVWAHSVMERPALDLVSAALLIPGLILVLARYLRRRDWRDLFLVLSIPMLMLPSIMSIAFPDENPALNRTSAAIIPIMIVIALCLDGIMSALEAAWKDHRGKITAWGLALVLMALAAWQNYDLVFNQYDQQYRAREWNSTELGNLVRKFLNRGNSIDQVFVVAYPNWVDSRIVGITAGHPEANPFIAGDQLRATLDTPQPLMFLLNQDDTADVDSLKYLYPQGILKRYTSSTPRFDFWAYYVPSDASLP